jgi:hypothetical protein
MVVIAYGPRMSNRRRLRGTGYSKRAALVAETVITAGMVAAWQEDPTSVPPEWADFWADHGPAPADFVDRAPEADRDDVVRDPETGQELREATALDALRVAAERRDAAEASISAMVALARIEGQSWQKIGDCIGMSKQATQKRYDRLAL